MAIAGKEKGAIVWRAPGLAPLDGRARNPDIRSRTVGPRHFTGARERIIALSRGRNIDVLLSNNQRSCYVTISLYPDNSSVMNAPPTLLQYKRPRTAERARAHTARSDGMRPGGIENAAERRRQRRKNLEATKCGLEVL
jgi:hypothetical protein